MGGRKKDFDVGGVLLSTVHFPKRITKNRKKTWR